MQKCNREEGETDFKDNGWNFHFVIVDACIGTGGSVKLYQLIPGGCFLRLWDGKSSLHSDAAAALRVFNSYLGGRALQPAPSCEQAGSRPPRSFVDICVHGMTMLSTTFNRFSFLYLMNTFLPQRNSEKGTSLKCASAGFTIIISAQIRCWYLLQSQAKTSAVSKRSCSSNSQWWILVEAWSELIVIKFGLFGCLCEYVSEGVSKWRWEQPDICDMSESLQKYNSAQ